MPPQVAGSTMRSQLPSAGVLAGRVVVLGVLLLAGLTCRTSHAPEEPSSASSPEPTPTAAASPTPTPTPVSVPGTSPQPTPRPGSAPTPTPTPTPSPTPAPTPSPTPSPTPTPTFVTITITGMNGTSSFSPDPAQVKVGQAIRWRNADATAHTATEDGNAWDTGPVDPGGVSPPITLSSAGQVFYHCTLHPTMRGTLVVTE